MKPAWRTGLLLATGVLGALAGYRVLAHTLADQWAASDPRAALRWIPGHPDALRHLAEQQLAAGEPAAARETARHLQQVAPLEGRALRIQAQAAAAQGRPDLARPLFEQAVSLSPRDIPARAWLTQDLLVRGEYQAALVQVDRILRYQPRQGTVLMPVLAQMAQDPAFAAQLVPALAARPPWRDALLREVQSGRHPQSAERVLGGLRQAGGLTPDEHARWVEDLMRQGVWSEAYARWASTLPAGTRLPLAYNGGFEQAPSQRGFDWRVKPVPGVGVTFEPTEGAQGLAAHITFRRRPVAQAGLELALLLPPGPQVLSMRLRADELRTDRGLEWQLQCHNGPVIATSERLQGTRPWHTLTVMADVPANCPGQWLRLRNPAPGGTGQFASGEVWVDDVAVIAPAR